MNSAGLKKRVSANVGLSDVEEIDPFISEEDLNTLQGHTEIIL